MSGEKLARIGQGLHILGDKVRKPSDLEIVDRLLSHGVDTVFSVPCSVTDTIDERWRDLSEEGKMRIFYMTQEHVLPGAAQGFFLASGKLALMHLQNSGLTNAGDGIISSARVYEIPTLAMVTWRGSSKADDSEPHQAIGELTEKLTDVIFGEKSCFGTKLGRGILRGIDKAIASANNGKIAAIRLSPEGFHKTYPLKTPINKNAYAEDREKRLNKLINEKGSSYKEVRSRALVTREEALQYITSKHENAAIIHANGYNARAAQHYTDRVGNFYEAGYMGGAIAIGWGMAVSNPDIEVVVVDGDANALMSHMNPNLFAHYPDNLNWYILDNGISASVGTSPSVPLTPDFYSLARVIRTIPEGPGEFKAPRVGKKGVYFDDLNEAEILAQALGGPLPGHAKRFRAWVEERTRLNIESKR